MAADSCEVRTFTNGYHGADSITSSWEALEKDTDCCARSVRISKWVAGHLWLIWFEAARKSGSIRKWSSETTESVLVVQPSLAMPGYSVPRAARAVESLLKPSRCGIAETVETSSPHRVHAFLVSQFAKT